MDWKLNIEKLENGFSTSDFWYDLTYGGYIHPEELLTDRKQIEDLENAIDLVKSFERALEPYIEEM